MPIVFCRYHSVFALNNHDSYSPRGAGCLLIHLRPSLPDFAGKATGIAGWLLTALLHYDIFARDILLMRIILTRTSKSFTDENGGFFPDTEAHGRSVTGTYIVERPAKPSSLKHNGTKLL